MLYKIIQNLFPGVYWRLIAPMSLYNVVCVQIVAKIITYNPDKKCEI